MGRQTSIRKLAVQILYQAALRPDTTIDVAGAEYLLAVDNELETKQSAIALAHAAWDIVTESDAIISGHSMSWSLDRITWIDKSILRLALYEMAHTDTPNPVIINEAIELAKRFSSDDAPGFINGILGAYQDVYRDR